MNVRGGKNMFEYVALLCATVLAGWIVHEIKDGLMRVSIARHTKEYKLKETSSSIRP